MHLFTLAEKLAQMRRINQEISYARCVRGDSFEAGVISFAPRSSADPKLITHADQEVVAQVIAGQGFVRIGEATHELRPGAVCHIPVHTPHDFYTTAAQPLSLFYLLIRSAAAPSAPAGGGAPA